MFPLRNIAANLIGFYNILESCRHSYDNGTKGVLRVVNKAPEKVTGEDGLPEDYDFEAYKELVPMQPGDVPVTYADTSALERDFGFKPSTSLRDGLRKFAEWYKEFYL